MSEDKRSSGTAIAEDKRKDEVTEERPEPERARREALAKMGRFAAYTAPVMLGLLAATKARAEAVGTVIC